MPTKGFPYSECWVCNQPIMDKFGMILASNFVREYLQHALDRHQTSEQLLDSDEAGLVNSITNQYFNQFHRHFHPRTGGITELSSHMLERIEEMRNHGQRLDEVLANPPDKFLFMLGHYDCLRDKGTYEIDLKRIDDCEKAIAWTQQLAEKNWFNFEGWDIVLTGLFGRVQVPG
jgi:hypothetical protein